MATGIILMNIGNAFTAMMTAVFVLPAIVLVNFANMKLIKFCDGCGSTLYNQNISQKMRFCSKCGENLEAESDEVLAKEK